MPWETRQRGRRYYTRSVKRNGRVEREYLGCGPAAELAARLDALERVQREEERQARREEQARYEAVDRSVAEFCESVELLAEAALVLAGCHWHERGEWRKRPG
jgi:hypothetical protein